MRALAAGAALLLGACFSPNFEGTMCSAVGECPEGFTCGTDNRCHAPGSIDASVDPPDADPNRPDAVPGTPDASTIDAVPGTPDGSPDAPGLPDAGVIQCTASALGAAQVIQNGTICYARYANRESWGSAFMSCTARGGHLVTIANAQERDTVRNLHTGNVPLWIGLQRPVGGGGSQFEWVTGEPLSFASWQSGEPNFSGDCVRQGQMGGGAVDFWYDDDCVTLYEYVCEFND